ncbi:DHS-like NAD/FAD-binding domain-containing protein [Gloeopeniophorella convolvens]|nr:DHS-like NAD/FAD-binding domain-containing protein [Gloeopeniophorella convolvens]
MDDYGTEFLEEVLGLDAGGDVPGSHRGSLFERKDVQSLAEYIKSEACQQIYLMLGAGVSTSAGIPDFRSPETGLYANLARLKLPYPEAVFDIQFFRRNPQPFYALAKELYPGKYRPTPTHSFIKLLANKGLLGICYTQNIDTLERRAGVPAHKIIEAHGSFATQRCIDCKRPFGDVEIKRHVEEERIPKCKACKGLVKPDIVFFGEAMPPNFFTSRGKLSNADLLIVIGTSLTVHPFASLTSMVTSHCPRVLINMDEVGDIGRQENDIVLLGKCDDIIRELAKELGWEAELDKEWESTAASLDDHAEAPAPSSPLKDKKSDEENRLELEVAKLTEKVESALSVSEEIEAGAGDKAGRATEPVSASVRTIDDDKAKEVKDVDPSQAEAVHPEDLAGKDRSKAVRVGSDH